jgi:hypothetical protein
MKKDSLSVKPDINSSKLTFFSDDESYLDDNSNGPDGPDSMVPQASKIDIEKKGKKDRMKTYTYEYNAIV